jgi:cytidine deaminase
MYSHIEPNRIIAACNEVAGPDLKPCVKQSVYAVLVTVDGMEFFGANWMTNGDVSVCPRVLANSKSGEDYHFCIDVCNQTFHGERAAIDACINAGYSTVGSVVYVIGHTYCCDGCIAAMQANGVAKAVVVDSGKVYNF